MLSKVNLSVAYPIMTSVGFIIVVLLSNLLVGHVDHLMEKTETVLVYVGGLPVKRTWPYDYKAVFSPAL